MPNTNKGGGISRKINNASDRRRLKQVLGELSIPDGIGVIVRTAGSRRSKAEIRRDYEYLMRLWNEIRETTLNSTAPCLIYEEANLIKRAIRDLYTSEMDEIQVEGEEGYKAAKAFMKSLMPSHAKKVQLFDDDKVPLFQRHQIEAQLDAMHSTTVRLRSGGYIVLNPTEALVAIDVNSGKATRERHIEETALKTNLEAAEEVGRQLRLRDLAGLIVIDFIDMENSRNNREVERKLKDALRNDRARIQLGRISPFGLLEMSRQRLRPSLFESSHMICSRCDGTGYLRTVESSALHVLRGLEEDAIRRGGGAMRVSVAPDIALYILNQKRDRLLDIERRHDLKIEIATDEGLTGPDFRPDRLSSTGGGRAAEETEDREEEDGERRRGRRRRSRRRDEEEAAPAAQTRNEDQSEDLAEDNGATEELVGASEGDERPKKRRRRGKRGGRRRSRGDGETPDNLAAADAPKEAAPQDPSAIAGDEPTPDFAAEIAPAGLGDAPAEEEADSKPPAEKPKRRRASRAKKAVVESAPDDDRTPASAAPPPDVEAAPESESPTEEKPKRKRATRSSNAAKTKRPSRRKKADDTAPTEPAIMTPEPEAPSESPRTTREAPAPMEDSLPPPAAATSANGGAGSHEDEPKRRGWWSRFV
jgi:ribonuclease E